MRISFVVFIVDFSCIGELLYLMICDVLLL